MRSFVSARYVLPALLLAACRPDPSDAPGAGSAPGAAGADTAAVLTAGSDSLRLVLLVPARVRAGAPVPITLRVENTTRRTLDLYLRGREPTFDVVIVRAAGDVVWRRLEREIIPAILRLRALGPGERLELEAVWDQRTNQGNAVGPGEYVARGSLLVEGDALQPPPAAFEILAE